MRWKKSRRSQNIQDRRGVKAKGILGGGGAMFGGRALIFFGRGAGALGSRGRSCDAPHLQRTEEARLEPPPHRGYRPRRGGGSQGAEGERRANDGAARGARGVGRRRVAEWSARACCFVDFCLSRHW